ncbi:AIPR family protein [Psychrobacter sp.]|mgnify:CR=1 FL=1|uniref:AIPR family protein n=2 Tax=Psychrobacter TaxID=497 RepID=UPI003C77F91D
MKDIYATEMIETYEFPVKAFRNLPSPFGEYNEISRNPVVYEFYLEIQDVPNNIPMDTNPREQNLSTQVAKSIKESLFMDDGNFHIKNRGIIISAADISYNTRSSIATIKMEDPEVHGNIDGGHTYKIILQNRDKITEKVYVRFEVIVGAESFFPELAKARNTSVQVSEKSIAELEKKFELIKLPLQNIEGIDLNDQIAFVENDSDKRILIENIISIIYNFNIQDFPDSERQPVSTYSQKNYCLKQYIKYHNEMQKSIKKEKSNPFYKMITIIPDILKLYDYIESTLHEKYKDAVSNGKYGALKGVQIKKDGSTVTFHTEILNKEIEFKSPRSFILPILASFRALVAEGDDGMYEWKADPFEYYDKLGAQMVKNTVDRSRSLGNNPNALGKDAGHWRDLYNLVDLEYKNHLIIQLMNQSKS